MTQAPNPPDETKRLDSLLALKILDTPPEERFERIVRTAAHLFDVPMVVLAFVDADRDWFKAVYGLPFTETPRDISFSTHALMGDDVLVVADTLTDPRFADNPLVMGEPFIRFCAAQPLSTASGTKVGSLSVMDRQPRQFSPVELKALQDLGAWAEIELQQNGLQQSLDTRSGLLATVGHEIRTPMNSVIGMVGLLLETNLNGEQLEMVEAIRTSSETLMSIISSILDFSRLESGKLTLEIENFEPSSLVETTVRLIMPHVRQKGIPIRVTIDPAIPPILTGDPGVLRQILLNLIDNAIKFTEKGEIHLEVRPEALEAATATLRFTVRDTGIGLSDTARQHLFQPFTQGDGSPTRRFGGTGLGLAICKRLVEMLGGQISVESQEGVGSAFWFTVQCGVPSATIISYSEPSEDGGASGSSSIVNWTTDPSRQSQFDPNSKPETTYRILLAEDNVVNQKITLRQLQKLGYSADSVINGMEAVEAVNQNSFDLVLMDCQMPIMGGFEATMQIREAEAQTQTGKHIPIIAMTANVLEGDREACINAGMDDYIGKPVSLDQLRDVLGRWLPINQPTPPVPVKPPPVPAPTPLPSAVDIPSTTLDVEAMENLRKLVQPAFLSALIDDFIKNSDELLSTLHVAAEHSDQEVLVRTAHTLKSSSANYGAKAFSALCRELEQRGRAGEFEGTQERISRIEAEYQNVKVALEIERNRGV